MRSLEMTAPWQDEEEDVEVEVDMELKHNNLNGRADDLTESSSDETTGKKRRKHGGK